MFKAVFALLAIVFGSQVSAQSSLGITGATLDLGSTEDEAGVRRSHATASVDVQVTGVHGLQGDLSFADTLSGTIGTASAHLYMAPFPDHKYGLFFSLSDLDGRALAWASAGVEAMADLGDSSLIEGRLGLGAADDGTLDYVFGGLSFVHAITPELEGMVSLDLADFDEARFRATSVEAGLAARYSPKGAPWGAFATLTRSDLSGRDGTRAETRLGVGISVTFGAAGGVSVKTRPFRHADPVMPILRRGLW